MKAILAEMLRLRVYPSMDRRRGGE